MEKKKLVIISWIITALIFLVFSGVASFAQDEAGASAREKRRNKVSVDRLIERLERSKREALMQPERVLDIFKAREGETVADVGAGTGFFAFRLASRVGPGGKVYAVEIEDKLLDYMGKKVEAEKVSNIILIKSTETSPNLPHGSCDRIMVAGSYYYFPDQVGFMKNLGKALKPGGLVAVVDLDKDRVSDFRKSKDRPLQVKTKSEISDEMTSAGYVLRESYDFLEHRFFMIFSLAPEAGK